VQRDIEQRLVFLGRSLPGNADPVLVAERLEHLPDEDAICSLELGRQKTLGGVESSDCHVSSPPFG
jgi:hypothetical protein